MSQAFKPIYCPALRMKAGELEGVRQLATDVADCILPRFIVPPIGERDESTPTLFGDARVPDIAGPLSVHWRDRPVIIDTTHIIDEYGRGILMDWLPSMYARARKNGVLAIPMAMLEDIGINEGPAFALAIEDGDTIKFAICVLADDMVGPEFREALNAALGRLGLTAEDCAVIADFGRSEFGDPGSVAPIIQYALETLQEFGRWQQVIFQGTHYPETIRQKMALLKFAVAMNGPHGSKR